MSLTRRFATSLVSGLFRRVSPQGSRFRPQNVRRGRSDCLAGRGGEKLEERLALAVDVVQFPTGGPIDWATIVVNEGSNAYVKAVATGGGQDIYVADNASFIGRDVIDGGNTGANALDEIHAYNGVLVEQSIDHANRVGTPLGPPQSAVDYPWYNGTVGDLAFPLNTQAIDFTESITGSISLNDGTANSTISFSNNNGALGVGTVQITSGPGAGTQMSYSLRGQSNLLVLVFRNPTYFSALTGETATPSLQITYDSDRDPAGSGVSIVGLDTMAVTVPGTQTNRFQVFEPTSQQYVPGTLRGRLEGLFANASFAVDWQINEPTIGGAIPISFGGGRALEVRVADMSLREDDGGTRAYDLFVSGSFNSVTGIASFSFRGDSDDNVFDGPVSVGSELTSYDVGVRDIDPTNNPGDPLGLLYDVQPNAFTLFDGQTFLPAIVADLPTPDSEVVVESPVTAANEIRLSASSVVVNAPLRSGTGITVPSGEASGFGTITERVAVNAAVGAPGFDIRLGDNPLSESITRSRLVVTQSGSLSNLPDVLSVPPETLPSAIQAYIEIEDGDAFIEGRVVATSQTWIMQSDEMVADVVSNVGDYPNFSPYVLTTRSAITGVDTGTIEATTFAVTLANDTLVLPAIPPVTTFVPSRAFSILDVTTDVARLRVQAADRGGDPLEVPFPYDITVREEDDLFVDAVAATSRPIDIETQGQLNLLGHIQSYGDVSLRAGAEFSLRAPVTTVFGQVAIEAPAVDVNAAVRVLDTTQDERDIDIRITATEDNLFIRDAVAGINRVVLRQQGDKGIIGGNGRIFADVLEIDADGPVAVRTAASRTSVRSDSSVSVDELDYGIFEIRDASDVTLVANGFDQIVSEADLGGGSTSNAALTSPALYADIYDASTITVSAPNGSVDVLTHGTGVLNVGSLSRIGARTATRMEVAGSTVIRSTLGNITVHDAPAPTGNATRVAVATTGSLDGTYRRGSPGVVPARISNSKIAKTAGGQLVGLDLIEFRSLRGGDLVLVKDGVADPNVGQAANGIYQVLEVRYPVDDPATPADESLFVEVDLVRAVDADTTAELAQKHYVRVTGGATHAGTVWTADGSKRTATGEPIYDGWGASNEYRFTNVFDNDPLINPVTVREIVPRTGFLPVRMMTDLPLLNGAFRAQYNSNGVIRGDGPDFRIPDFNGVTPRIGDLVLVAEGAGDGNGRIDPRSFGVFEVTGLGDGSANQWELTRYDGVDNDGDGVIDRFYTGRVAVNEGSLRTAKTGVMYEIGLESLGWVPLRYQPVSQFDSQAGQAFDSILNFRTDIGTGRPASPVIFNVSTEGGANDDTGSFGRMLTLVQSNSAVNARLGTSQEQVLQFAPSVGNVDLVQSLPEIYRPLTIQAGSPVFIDGTRIEINAQGQVVRSGSVLTRLGPVSPAEISTARRLVRDRMNGSFVDVNGLTFTSTSAGSVVSGLSFGGFNNGAAISVRAPNVLVNNVTIGRDRAGNAVANRVGVEFIVPQGGTGVDHSTLLNSTILSADVGVQLNTGAERVHVVGNAIGVEGSGNQRGIELLTQTPVPSFIGASGVTAVSPITVSGRVTAINSQDEATVYIDSSLVTQYVRKNMFVLDSNSSVDREIIDIGYDSINDDEFWVLTIADASKTNASGSGALVVNGNLSGQIGHRLQSGTGGVPTTPGKVTAGDSELILPPTFAEGDTYLGMEISSLQAGVGTANPVVGISNLPSGQVVLELDRPITETSFSLLVIEQPSPNILSGNGDGVIIDSVSSRMVNTEVRGSVYDGIRIERTDAAGKHIIGDAIGSVPGEDFAGNPIQITPNSLQNVVVFGNGLSGVRLTDEAFRALGSFANPPNDSADYATIDAFLNDHLVIRGNSLGVNGENDVIGNGASGTENILVDLSLTDTRFSDQARIEFLLFEDTAVRDPGDPTDSDDDVPEARLRPVVSTGIDSLSNRHGVGSAGEGTVLPGTEIGDRRPIVR